MKSFCRLLPGVRIRKHFALHLDGRALIYSYIRKNACSAFKRLFVGESPQAFRCPDCSALGIMGRYHKARLRDLCEQERVTVVVLRDPYRRLVSTYLNKFVVRSGNTDIFDNYRRLTGRDPNRASFQEFLVGYVGKFPFKELDCHLIPQVRHLASFAYNGPVRFEHLYGDLRRVLGASYADKYFREKVNATYYAGGNVVAGEHASSDPEVLAAEYRRSGSAPAPEQFACDALDEVVAGRYGDDLVVVERLNDDYRRFSEERVPVLDVHLSLKRNLGRLVRLD